MSGCDSSGNVNVVLDNLRCFTKNGADNFLSAIEKCTRKNFSEQALKVFTLLKDRFYDVVYF